jgi:hypothetical protein
MHNPTRRGLPERPPRVCTIRGANQARSAPITGLLHIYRVRLPRSFFPISCIKTITPSGLSIVAAGVMRNSS